VLWTKTYSGDSDVVEKSRKVIETSDGGFLINGTGPGFAHFKIDANGNKLWGLTNNYWTGGIVETHENNGFLTVGTLDKDIILTKLDVSGGLIWQKSFEGGVFQGGGGLDLDEWGHSIKKTKDGNYIFTGNQLPEGTNQYNKYDLRVTKIDGEGEIIWSKVFGESWASWDIGYDLIEASDGYIYVVGTSKSDNQADTDTWVLKLDGEGKQIWAQKFKENDVKSVVEAHDGGIVIAGLETRAYKITPEGGSVPIITPFFGSSSAINIKQIGGKFIFNSGNHSSNSLDIYTSVGSFVKSIPLTEGKGTWQPNNNITGLLMIYSENGQGTVLSITK